MKKIFFVFLLICLSASLFSQSMTKRWLAEFPAGGTWSDFGKDLVQDASGNVYVASQVDNGSDLNIVLIKYNSVGELQWSQTFDNGADDMAIRVHLDAAENIYVTGNTVMGGVNQVLILKYLPDGTLRWQENTSSLSGATAMASDIVNTNVVITGYAYSSATDANVLTMKYDSAGTLTWSQSYDQSGTVSTDIEKGLDIAIRATTGDIYISGTATVSGSADFLVLKYNSAGVQQFATTRDYSTSTDNAYSISIGGVGAAFAVYVTGRCVIPAIGNRMVTMKFSSTGVFQWATPFTGNNEIYIANSYFNGTNIYSIGYDNGGANVGTYLVKYNASGTEQWSTKTSNSYYSMYGTNGAVVSNGSLYVNDMGEIKKVDVATGAFLDSVTPIGATIYSMIAGANGVLATGIKSSHDEVVTFEVCTPIETLSLNHFEFVCQNDTFSLQASGASSYLWSSTSPYVDIIEPNIANASALSTHDGIYYAQIIAFDVNGCPLPTDSVRIETYESPELPPSYIVNDLPLAFCSGGYTELEVRWTQPNYEYEWYHNGSFANGVNTTFTATDEGQYYVVVSNSMTGCTDQSETVSVSFITSPGLVNLGPDQSICENDSVMLLSNVWGLYQWNTGDSASNIMVHNSGTYVLTVTVPGCTPSVDSIDVQVGSVSLGGDIEACMGENITIDAGLGFLSYSWSSGETTRTIQPISSGAYSVTVVHSLCGTFVDTIDVVFHSIATPSLGNDTTICIGNTILLDAGTANGYNWNTGATSLSIIASSSGEYIVVVSDAYGCEKSDTLQLTVSALPVVDLGNDTSVCDYLYIEAGIHDSYLWSDNSTFDYIEITSSGDYSVTVANAAGCESADTISIVIVVSPSVDITTSYSVYKDTGAPDIVACEGDTVELNAQNAGCTYMWSTGSSSQIEYVTSNGTYRVTVTESTGMCSEIGDVEIAFNDKPYASATLSEASCGLSDGSAAIHVLGGNSPFLYNWSNTATADSLGNLAAGAYSVIVEDTYGCLDTVSFTITNPNAPIITSNVESVSCFGECDGIAEALITGGTAPFSFEWSNGDTTAVSDSLCSSTYSVTVTDANSCESMETFVVAEPDILEISMASIPEAYSGASDGEAWVLVLGGTGPYSYEWNNSSVSDTISGIAGGWYYVTVTDANDCSATDSIEVTITVGLTQVESSIRIFPNPSSGQYIVFEGIDPLAVKRIELISIDGRSVGIHNEGNQIDLNETCEGIYILRIFSTDKLLHQEKLVIVK